MSSHPHKHNGDDDHEARGDTISVYHLRSFQGSQRSSSPRHREPPSLLVNGVSTEETASNIYQGHCGCSVVYHLVTTEELTRLLVSAQDG